MNEQKLCRLCLEVILGNNFESLDDIKLRMLQILHLNLDVEIGKDPKICSKCAQILQLSFEFKTTCLNNNDYLKTYVGSDDNVKLNLKEVIIKNIFLGIKSEEENVCRLCLNYFEINLLVELNNFEEDVFLKDMFVKCLPELNINITEGPSLCNNCMELLQNQFNFMMNFMDNEDKISYFHSENVDLYNIVERIKSLKNEPKNALVEAEYIKQEKIDSYTGDNFIKTEQEDFSLKIEDGYNEKQEYIDALSESICPTKEHNKINDDLPIEPNSVNIYPCTICPYQTDRRADLEKHNITHKDPSEVQLYKCTKCDFATKWKGDVDVHNLRHINPSDVNMHKCPKCPYQTKYKQHLTRHDNQRHATEKRYKCTVCNYKAYERWVMKKHYKDKHRLNVELELFVKYSCRRCDFVGESKEELETHKKTHNQHRKSNRSTRTYECELCEYNTNAISHLKYHIKTHRSLDDEEETFTCYDCGFKTKYKNSLVKHIKNHKKGERKLGKIKNKMKLVKR